MKGPPRPLASFMTSAKGETSMSIPSRTPADPAQADAVTAFVTDVMASQHLKAVIVRVTIDGADVITKHTASPWPACRPRPATAQTVQICMPRPGRSRRRVQPLRVGDPAACWVGGRITVSN